MTNIIGRKIDGFLLVRLQKTYQLLHADTLRPSHRQGSLLLWTVCSLAVSANRRGPGAGAPPDIPDTSSFYRSR